ncbi:MAG: DUF5777 family beta-barrel protein [Flavobacteriales bacterium]
MRYLTLPIILFGLAGTASAQGDLLDLLGTDSLAKTYTTASFKGTRVINGHSIENVAHGVLDFRISHRMGFVNEGVSNFFGLDQATLRLGFDYGISDRLMVGIGRSSYQKTVDGLLKYKVLRQCDAGCSMPVTVDVVLSSAVTTLVAEQVPWFRPGRPDFFPNRVSYNIQAVVGRKFTEGSSLQLTPGLVHRNLVITEAEHNDLLNIGVAGRAKVSKRVAITGEYFYVLPGQGPRDPFHNSLAFGVDIETGGHVFQLQLTNSTGMFERAFITETTGDPFEGDIHFGFNISRVFTVYDPKAKARRKAAEQAK